jgi:hypothetical protein
MLSLLSQPGCQVRVGGGIPFFTASSIYQSDILFQPLALADRALREG